MRFSSQARSSRQPVSARAGFTLVELLIVFVIIGILAAAFGPKAFDSYKSGAVVTSLQRDVGTMNGLAMARYAENNGVANGFAAPDTTNNLSSGNTASFTGTGTQTLTITVQNAGVRKRCVQAIGTTPTTIACATY